MSGFLVIIGIILVVAVIYYNGFITKKNQIENSRSDIEIQLKRRHDLIPNLVETVKGYKDFEASTLNKLTEARTHATHSHNLDSKATAETNIEGVLGKFFAVAENYPDLKSSQNFLDLQNELSNIEDALQNARRYYNATVREYNTSCETFPGNMVAQRFKFTKKEFFQVEADAKKHVKVSF